MTKRYIILDKVTDQVLSWFDPEGNDTWNAGIDRETNEVVGNPYTFGPRHLAEEVVELLAYWFRNEPDGIDFRILEVNVEITPERKCVTLL